jgi:hypothetical protein
VSAGASNDCVHLISFSWEGPLRRQKRRRTTTRSSASCHQRSLWRSKKRITRSRDPSGVSARIVLLDYFTVAVLLLMGHFEQMSLKYHPDKNKEEGAEDMFMLIAEAYECLSNEVCPPEVMQSRRIDNTATAY